VKTKHNPTIPNPVTIDGSPEAVRGIVEHVNSELLNILELAACCGVRGGEQVTGKGDDPYKARRPVENRIALDIFDRLQPAIAAAVSQALEAVHS
jgi:CO dehydrogenase/acetyl-CoA synthase delta subunit